MFVVPLRNMLITKGKKRLQSHKVHIFSVESFRSEWSWVRRVEVGNLNFR